MLKIIKTGVVVLACGLLSWLLPWLLAFMTASPSWHPFTLYSCIVHSFAQLDYDCHGKVFGRDFNGNRYTERQIDSIMPLFYYRQLAAEGRFPSEIEGVKVTPQDAERTGFIFRTTPSEINRPRTGLYQILESRPRRLEFESPTDVFRITGHAMEFVDMATNTVNADKSRRFTAALQEAGFRFPARLVSGNASTQKEYDNGYFLKDDSGQIFHLLQIDGRPQVHRIALPDSLEITHIFVTEFADRRHLAFMSDSRQRFHALRAGDYSLHEVSVGPFDAANDALMIIGDMFYWTVTLQRDHDERLMAINARDYSLVDSYTPPAETTTAERVGKYLFPTALSFTSAKDAFVRPRLAPYSPHALWLGAVLAVVYAFVHRRRFTRHAMPTAGILLLGFYLFLPLLLLGHRK